MAATDIEVANNALVSIGAGSIASFSDGSTESDIASTIYETYVKAELASGRYTFAKEQTSMNRLTAAPTEGWDYAYQLPSNLLTLTRVTFGDEDIKYERVGDKVFTNTKDENDTVVAHYTFRVLEPNWPAHFEQAVVDGLMLRFAVALGLEKWILQSIATIADTARKDARREDSQNETAKRLRLTRFKNRRL